MASAAEYNKGSLYNLNNDFNLVVVEGNSIHQDADVMVNLITPDFDTKTEYWRKLTNDAVETTTYKECKAKAPEGLDMGEYVVTSYSKSPDPESEPQYIYNWACVDSQSRSVDLQVYTQALVETFEIANSMELSSIAVPVISRDDMVTNDKQFIPPNDEIASKLCNTILALSEENPLHVKTVKLVVQDENLSKVYTAVLNKLRALQPTELSQSDTDSTVSDPQTQDESVNKGIEEPTSPYIYRSIDQSSSPNTTYSGSFRSSRNGDNEIYSRQSPRDSVSPSGPNLGQGARAKYNRHVETAINKTNQKVSTDSVDKSIVDVFIFEGDIARQNVDVLVHPTNYIRAHIDITGNVGCALANAGGPSFRTQCQNVGTSHSAQKELAITDAGSLPCNKVIHVNITGMNTLDEWASLLLKCLCMANNLGHSSVAFPPVGRDTDTHEFKAACFRQAIENFKLTQIRNLEKIYILLQDRPTVEIFNQIILYDGIQKGHELLKTVGDGPIDVFPLRGSNLKPENNNTINYNGVTITVTEGDISEERVHCIVHGVKSSITDNLIPTSDPVGNVLYEKGGFKFKEECNKNNLKRGSHVITSGGNMPCKNVLHIDTTDHDLNNTWGNLIVTALRVAEEFSMKIVSFPVIGGANTDVTTLSKTQMAAVASFISSSPSSLQEVRFVVFRRARALKAFQEAMHNLGNYAKAQQATSSQETNNTIQHRGPSHSQPQLQVPSIHIEVIEGDIAKNTCDMIVHGTSAHYQYIQLDDKVGKALAEAGGAMFKQACLNTALKPGTCDVTLAGDLKCRGVLHVDISDMTAADDYAWAQRFYQILFLTDARQMRSLAIPPLGTVSKSTLEWKGMVTLFKSTVTNFTAQINPKYLRTVQFVIHKNRVLYSALGEVIPKGTNKGDTGSGDRITVQGKTSAFTVIVVQGDLTKENTDAIVHATNEKWSFSGSRVGKAIASAGGKGLCDSRDSARAKHYGHRPITIISKSGTLPCKHVIHVDMTHHAGMNEKILACLKEAANLTSIAFPALGTGTLKGDVRSVALSFKDAIKTFSESTKQTKLDLIKIVIFEDYMKSQFLDVLKTI